MPPSNEPLIDLRLERPSPGVARLVLDNPAQRNAMSDAMTASWSRAIDELAADPDVRVVVVTGEGSAFCSGGNPACWLRQSPSFWTKNGSSVLVGPKPVRKGAFVREALESSAALSPY